jgi:glycosyltransferase involved in cell wall biosynthesis
MSDAPLLTIAIPTYNRLGCLRRLLETLLEQSRSVPASIEVLVSNNASNDGTASYLQQLAATSPVRVTHQAVNCGAVLNLLHCFDVAQGRYIWIMGDDDLPMDGVLQAVADCLTAHEPELLYMPSTWINGEPPRRAIPSASTERLSAFSLAARASHYTTFLSAWIVDRQAYRRYRGDHLSHHLADTLFPHLEWIFTLLLHGKRLHSAGTSWILATASNSGGYSVFEAFAKQYVAIVDDKLAADPALSSLCKTEMLWCFIPGLIWGVRNRTAGNFSAAREDEIMRTLDPAYGHSHHFRWIVRPLLLTRGLPSYLFWNVSRALRIARRLYMTTVHVKPHAHEPGPGVRAASKR